MAFEKFENRHKKAEERITITRSQSIGFPSQFYDDNNIKNFKFVELFWDGETREIGIVFTEEEPGKKSGFAIAKSKEGYGGSVVARSFFKHYKIDTKLVYGKYEWKKVQQQGAGDMFVIKLVNHQ